MKRIALMAVLLMTWTAAHAEESKSQMSLQNGITWEAPDLKGNVIHSTNYLGKVTLVVFWATWCPLCVEEVPILNDLVKKYSSKGVTVIGATVDEDAAEVVPGFMKSHEMKYAVLLGSEEMQAAFGGIDSLPAAFLLDRNGKVVEQFIGYTEAQEFTMAVNKTLKAAK